MKFIRSIAVRRKQRGVAAVEFAMIAALLFTLLFGIMEMSRVLFAMNTTVEATRLGARLAVVCDKDAPVIKNKMIDMLGYLTPGNINVVYTPGGCDVSSCRSVTVSIAGLTVDTFIPLVPFTLNMPAFSTTLPRESMTSLNNPICT
jgi:Flp pilus assembly pilin Flp